MPDCRRQVEQGRRSLLAGWRLGSVGWWSGWTGQLRPGRAPGKFPGWPRSAACRWRETGLWSKLSDCWNQAKRRLSVPVSWWPHPGRGLALGRAGGRGGTLLAVGALAAATSERNWDAARLAALEVRGWSRTRARRRRAATATPANSRLKSPVIWPIVSLNGNGGLHGSSLITAPANCAVRSELLRPLALAEEIPKGGDRPLRRPAVTVRIDGLGHALVGPPIVQQVRHLVARCGPRRSRPAARCRPGRPRAARWCPA